MDKKLDLEHIRLARTRLKEIKAKQQELKDAEKEICEWLDQELIINKHDRLQQKFDLEDGTVIKAKVPQNFNLNQPAFEVLMDNCPELQKYSDAFVWKAEVKEGVWWKLPADVQAKFASVVTVNPGKTSWEFPEDKK